MQLHFFLALQCLVVLLLKVNLVVQDLVVESDDAPPKNVSSHLVKLLCELIEDSRAALAKKVSPIVVHELHSLLAFQCAQIKGIRVVVSFLSGAFLAHHDGG